ncbi:hypothetical protein OBBRIDRAFT_792678 [Obba rivulosa]|uniref:Uncharacterized protein n=1 Tax=Obba rivulosa TaxID=1052685 RepID=A0A8E2AU85_9APHY|nr:hypothetical protein OBBRIDRAFT_792678 [Obba rivulosa]
MAQASAACADILLCSGLLPDMSAPVIDPQPTVVLADFAGALSKTIVGAFTCASTGRSQTSQRVPFACSSDLQKPDNKSPTTFSTTARAAPHRPSYHPTHLRIPPGGAGRCSTSCPMSRSAHTYV